MRRSYTAVSMVFPILKYAADRGYDPESFCRTVSFDSGLLRDADARIPVSELSRLMQETAALTGDDHIGLHMEGYMEPADLGVLGYVMMHAATIREALDAYVQYFAILSDGFRLAWETEGDALIIGFTFDAPALAVRHCAEDMAASVLAMIRRFAHRRPAVREIRFRHEAPPDTAPYLETFGVMPLFGTGENVIRLDRHVVDWPILYADERLRAMFESVADEKRTARAADDKGPFTGAVLECLRASLPSGLPTLAQAADHFGVSARTLQMRLRAEGATYSELVTQVRRQTAIRLLGQDRISIAQIAFLLHYTEPSAFQNAFKKWTGTSPGQYRRQAGRSGQGS